MNIIKKNISIFIIILFHFVGLIGFIWAPELFKKLSPVNLLLSILLILISAKQNHYKFYLSLISIAIFGFFIEVVGVKTGLIFGTYKYGWAMGFQLLSVPLLIGANWAVLLYSTSQFCKFKNHIINSLFGAFLMTFLDYFIEQCASKFDFWYWENNKIPLKNYFAWFIISFILNLIFQKILTKNNNNTAKVFYLTQIAFFALLFLFFKQYQN